MRRICIHKGLFSFRVAAEIDQGNGQYPTNKSSDLVTVFLNKDPVFSQANTLNWEKKNMLLILPNAFLHSVPLQLVSDTNTLLWRLQPSIKLPCLSAIPSLLLAQCIPVILYYFFSFCSSDTTSCVFLQGLSIPRSYLHLIIIQLYPNINSSERLLLETLT